MKQKVIETFDVCNVYIPMVIVEIILFYYNSNLKFNQDVHGDYLDFIEANTVSKCVNDTRFSVCIHGDAITSNDCKSFKLYIKWKKCDWCFQMGYITSLDSVKDWNSLIGSRENKMDTSAICVTAFEKYFMVFNQDHNVNPERLDYIAPSKFKEMICLHCHLIL
eukprot:242343_1